MNRTALLIRKVVLTTALGEQASRLTAAQEDLANVLAALAKSVEAQQETGDIDPHRIVELAINLEQADTRIGEQTVACKYLRESIKFLDQLLDDS